MVIEILLQTLAPMVLEYVIRDVAAPAAKRMVRGTPTDTSGQAGTATLAFQPTAARFSAVRAVHVVSETPGRLRVEVSGLKGRADLAGKLADDMTAIRGVARVEASMQTGRVLVHFDPAMLTVAALVTTIDRARALHLDVSAPRARQLAAVV